MDLIHNPFAANQIEWDINREEELIGAKFITI